MRASLASCSLLLPLLLTACPADDDDTDATTVAMTTTASTTEASAESGSTAATVGTTAGTSTEGSSAADTTTGSGPEVCETCDVAVEYCFASLFDGPTEYSCRPVPEECLESSLCDCITPIECPKGLQSCGFEGNVIVLKCVEG